MSEIDYNQLSDEELSKLDLSNAEVNWGNQANQTSEPVATEENQQTDDAMNTSTTDTQNTVSKQSADEPVEQVSEQEQNQDSINADTDTDTQVSQTAVDDTDNGEQTTDDDQTQQVDYQAFYETLTKPFKANGREIQVKSAEDMIALMQQGANYSKKMAQLKPNLAVLKTLEQHGLNDAQSVAYMVDLYNKNPEAIAKLIKEADIDLYSFDTEQADNYTPQTQVNEPSLLEETMVDLYGSHDKFKDVVSDITTVWDEQSKAMVSDHPEILRVMAEQAQSGLYQQITQAMEYERMLGRMQGVPFLAAYEAIEAKLLQANQSANTGVDNQQPQQQAFTAPRPQNTQNQVNNQTQKQKAAVPKSGNSKANNEFDPLKLSDEEFLKFYNQQKFH
ncbi:hypothetical protein ACFBZI_09405 [Moraxella sp. ZJ142]|uniref:hypothetical protein n=1 Tax=Moraxella marmotae TaxID=3344520 RepID=UPI0035D507FF